jgi:hypothetical protein
MSTKTFALPRVLGSFAPRVSSVTKDHKLARHNIRRGIAVKPKRAWFSASKDQVKSGMALALSGLIVVTFLAYVFGINQSAAKGYEIKKQQQKLSQLKEQNEQLQVRAAEIGSMTQIQMEAATNQLVQITNQEYLQPNQLSQR